MNVLPRCPLRYEETGTWRGVFSGHPGRYLCGTRRIRQVKLSAPKAVVVEPCSVTLLCAAYEVYIKSSNGLSARKRNTWQCVLIP